MSQATRHQLEDSIKKQAEITAVAFKQWLEAQRTPLATVAAYVDEPPAAGLDLPSTFALIVKTRSQWAGLLVLNPAGETAFSQPRASPPTALIPVIFLTVKDQKEDRINGFRVGVDAYVTKPFEPDELLAVVGAIFNRLEPTRAEFSRLLGAAETAAPAYGAALN